MDTARAAKLIRMLSSDHDGEVIAAARKLCQMGIHEIAETVERPRGGAEPLQAALDLIAEQKIKRLQAEVRSLKKQLKVGLIRCLACGTEFRASRSDAVTCSARCRKRLQRHG